MGLIIKGGPVGSPNFERLTLEVPTPVYSGKKSSDANDSINPYTSIGPGDAGGGLTEAEIAISRGAIPNTTTWNPDDKGIAYTLSNGDLTVVHNGGLGSIRSIAGISSGKNYWEGTWEAGSSAWQFGIAKLSTVDIETSLWLQLGTTVLLGSGSIFNEGGNIGTFGAPFSINDVIGIALNMDIGAIWMSKNGVWFNSATISEIEAGNTTNAIATGLTGGYHAVMGDGSSAASPWTWTTNFGATAMVHTVPSGFTVGIQTPPVSTSIATSPDPFFNDVVFVTSFDGFIGTTDFTDSSSKGKIITNNNTVRRSDEIAPKFGLTSAFFNGTNQSLQLTIDVDLDMTSIDYTVELWAYPISGDFFMALGDFVQGTDGVILLYRVASSAGATYIEPGSTSINRWNITKAGLINQWIHFALTRETGNTKIFINGAQSGSTVTTFQNEFPADGIITMGSAETNLSSNTPGFFQQCYIQEVRITKGVARYTANFTPSTEPFPLF